jgi:hypothetical protein
VSLSLPNIDIVWKLLKVLRKLLSQRREEEGREQTVASEGLAYLGPDPSLA